MFINDVDIQDFDLLKILEERFEFKEKVNFNDSFVPSVNASMNRKDSYFIIQKQEELNIDYIVFMVCEMGLEVIEDTVYQSLWDDTLNIQQESRNLSKMEWRKKQFLKKLEAV